MWRSPEAHLLGVEVVAGSNPVTPTIFFEWEKNHPFLVPILPKSFLAFVSSDLMPLSLPATWHAFCLLDHCLVRLALSVPWRV